MNVPTAIRYCELLVLPWSVQVKDVTLEQLLDQVLKPAGLSANVSPTTLEVVSP